MIRSVARLVRRMFNRQRPTILPPIESTMTAITETRARHAAATPRHRRVLRRADAALNLFEAYQSEAEFIEQARHQQ